MKKRIPLVGCSNHSREIYIYFSEQGDVAQMVERLLSMREVEGSMPFVSINHVGRVV